MKQKTNAFTIAALAVFTLGTGSVLAQATATFTTNANLGTNNDTWTAGANWDTGYMPGDTTSGNPADSAVIQTGLTALANSTAVVTYSGGLTIEENATLQIGSGGSTENRTQSASALGTGPITMEAGSKILWAMKVSPTPPSILLNGDASIVQTSNESHARQFTFANGISGPGQLTFLGVNNGSHNFTAANPSWSGGFVAGVNENTRTRFNANASGCFGTGDVTIGAFTDLDINAADVIDDGATLTINGAGRDQSPSTKLIMDASDTVDQLFRDGLQAPAGTYGRLGLGGVDFELGWISGNSILTVVTGSTESTAPTVVSWANNVGDGPIYEDQAEVTYTVTFDEDISTATVATDDFAVIGTGGASGTVSSVTKTSVALNPAVFSVVVQPSGTGTIQLQIPGSATIEDLNGNALVVPVSDSTVITINAGSTPNTPGNRYWDGPTTAGITDGVSQGGSGTWDNGTTTNWDRGVGFANPIGWSNANNDDAFFGGTAGTVTVAEPISLGDMSFDLLGQYTIDGGTLNFAPGSTIRTADNRYDQTITSAITGSPNVETKDFGAGNQYKGFIFAPTSGTQTLGVVLNPNNTGNTDKAGVTFAGSTTGNTVASVDYAGGDRYANTILQSGEWSIPGGIRTGTIRVTGGTFTLGGTVQGDYQGFEATGGTVKGDFTFLTADRRGTIYMKSGSTISPGNSVGTVTVDWGTGGTPAAGENDYSLWMQDGSTYDWEVGAGNTTDTIHLVEGRLYVDNMTLNIIDAGGNPGPADQLPVFTYEPGVLIDLVGFANNFILPAGWSGTPSLVDNGVDTVYITGIDSGGGPANPYTTWASVNAPSGNADDDFDGDGVSNAIEFALGGDKDTNDLGKLPVVGDDGTNMTFTFVRDQASAAASVSTVIEVGTDLVSWPSIYTVGADTGSSTAGVTVTDNADGTDTVVLSVAKAPDAKKFARLKVVITP